MSSDILDIGHFLIKALSKSFDEIITKLMHINRTMVKLWNNEPSIIQSWSILRVELRLTRSKRTWILRHEVENPLDIVKLAERFHLIAEKMEETELYAPLPDPVSYKPVEGIYDGRIENVAKDPSKIAEMIVDEALAQGVDRVAGTITLSSVHRALITSKGFEGLERKSSIEAYIRAFKGEYSGHWAYASTKIDMNKLREVGRKAGHYATIMCNKADFTPGKYDIVISPLVVGNLFNYIANMASAFNVMVGYSMFIKYRPGDVVGSEAISLIDRPREPMLPGACGFDDEGVETYDKPLIERGVFKGYLHNTATAIKMNERTTGNANWMVPRAWNLEITPGSIKEDELPSELRNGVIIMNNWYTRLQNYIEGLFSTVSKDAVFIVKNGEIAGQVDRVRIACSFPHILSNIVGASRELYSISWWEVQIPTMAPYLLIRDVPLTKPEI
ncbi:MAG: TldD/PmbA family protein [Desulfurococcaceae archaeon]